MAWATWRDDRCSVRWSGCAAAARATGGGPVSQPVVEPDIVPEPDDVHVTDPEELPDIYFEGPEPPSDEQEEGSEVGIEDVDDIPAVPGGDFLNRRSRFPVGGTR